MKRIKALLLAVLILLMCLFCAAGCLSSTLRMDSIHEELPAIDPQDSLTRQISATLYYRLGGYDTLIPVNTMIPVNTTEHTETALVRALLSDDGPLDNSAAEPIMPEGTRLIDLTLKNDILYVTFNRDFMSAVKEGESRQESENSHRLAVYAVVNTLTALGNASRVQILIDLDGTGSGTRLPANLFGLSSDSSSQLLEPLSFRADAVASPEIITESFFCHLAAGEYDSAYALIAASETGGRQKPSLEAFETALKNTGTITSYEITAAEIAADARTASVTVNLSWQDSSGRSHTSQSASLQLFQETGVYQLGYTSLLTILERSTE